MEFIAKEIILIKKGRLLLLDTPHAIIDQMKGKVFEPLIQPEELKAAQEKYRISNIIGEREGIRIRIVGDENPAYEQTEIVKPTLEDLYLYHFADDEAL